jgi:hypothetical protein
VHRTLGGDRYSEAGSILIKKGEREDIFSSNFLPSTHISVVFFFFRFLIRDEILMNGSAATAAAAAAAASRAAGEASER